MKTRVTLIAVGLFLTVLAGLYLLRASTPEAANHPAQAAPGALSGQAPDTGAEDASAAADAARRLQTAAAYTELEASRKSLQRQLSDLKSYLWGRELPAEQARNIGKDMMSAQYLLRNPPLLGAFEDAAGVYAEKDRVQAAAVRLQEISRTLGASMTP